MSSTSLLEMKHVKKTFGSLEVLKDISIEVNEGEVVAIIGPSGSCLLYTSPSPRD